MNELYANLKKYINEIPLSNTIADKTKAEYLKEYTVLIRLAHTSTKCSEVGFGGSGA